MYYRQSRRIERCVIARTISISARFQVEARVPVEGIEQGGKFESCAGSEYDESVVSEPADHIHVDHGNGPGQRVDRVAHIVR